MPLPLPLLPPLPPLSPPLLSPSLLPPPPGTEVSSPVTENVTEGLVTEGLPPVTGDLLTPPHYGAMAAVARLSRWCVHTVMWCWQGEGGESHRP